MFSQSQYFQPTSPISLVTVAPCEKLASPQHVAHIANRIYQASQVLSGTKKFHVRGFASFPRHRHKVSQSNDSNAVLFMDWPQHQREMCCGVTVVVAHWNEVSGDKEMLASAIQTKVGTAMKHTRKEAEESVQDYADVDSNFSPISLVKGLSGFTGQSKHTLRIALLLLIPSGTPPGHGFRDWNQVHLYLMYECNLSSGTLFLLQDETLNVKSKHSPGLVVFDDCQPQSFSPQEDRDTLSSITSPSADETRVINRMVQSLETLCTKFHRDEAHEAKSRATKAGKVLSTLISSHPTLDLKTELQYVTKKRSSSSNSCSPQLIESAHIQTDICQVVNLIARFWFTCGWHFEVLGELRKAQASYMDGYAILRALSGIKMKDQHESAVRQLYQLTKDTIHILQAVQEATRSSEMIPNCLFGVRYLSRPVLLAASALVFRILLTKKKQNSASFVSELMSDHLAWIRSYQVSNPRDLPHVILYHLTIAETHQWMRTLLTTSSKNRAGSSNNASSDSFTGKATEYAGLAIEHGMSYVIAYRAARNVACILFRQDPSFTKAKCLSGSSARKCKCLQTLQSPRFLGEVESIDVLRCGLWNVFGNPKSTKNSRSEPSELATILRNLLGQLTKRKSKVSESNSLQLTGRLGRSLQHWLTGEMLQKDTWSPKKEVAEFMRNDFSAPAIAVYTNSLSLIANERMFSNNPKVSDTCKRRLFQSSTSLLSLLSPCDLFTKAFLTNLLPSLVSPTPESVELDVTARHVFSAVVTPFHHLTTGNTFNAMVGIQTFLQNCSIRCSTVVVRFTSISDIIATLLQKTQESSTSISESVGLAGLPTRCLNSLKLPVSNLFKAPLSTEFQLKVSVLKNELEKAQHLAAEVMEHVSNKTITQVSAAILGMDQSNYSSMLLARLIAFNALVPLSVTLHIRSSKPKIGLKVSLLKGSTCLSDLATTMLHRANSTTMLASKLNQLSPVEMFELETKYLEASFERGVDSEWNGESCLTASMATSGLLLPLSSPPILSLELHTPDDLIAKEETIMTCLIKTLETRDTRHGNNPALSRGTLYFVVWGTGAPLIRCLMADGKTVSSWSEVYSDHFGTVYQQPIHSLHTNSVYTVSIPIYAIYGGVAKLSVTLVYEPIMVDEELTTSSKSSVTTCVNIDDLFSEKQSLLSTMGGNNDRLSKTELIGNVSSAKSVARVSFKAFIRPPLSQSLRIQRIRSYKTNHFSETESLIPEHTGSLILADLPSTGYAMACQQHEDATQLGGHEDPVDALLDWLAGDINYASKQKYNSLAPDSEHWEARPRLARSCRVTGFPIRSRILDPVFLGLEFKCQLHSRRKNESFIREVPECRLSYRRSPSATANPPAYAEFGAWQSAVSPLSLVTTYSVHPASPRTIAWLQSLDAFVDEMNLDKNRVNRFSTARWVFGSSRHPRPIKTLRRNTGLVGTLQHPIDLVPLLALSEEQAEPESPSSKFLRLLRVLPGRQYLLSLTISNFLRHTALLVRPPMIEHPTLTWCQLSPLAKIARCKLGPNEEQTVHWVMKIGLVSPQELVIERSMGILTGVVRRIELPQTYQMAAAISGEFESSPHGSPRSKELKCIQSLLQNLPGVRLAHPSEYSSLVENKVSSPGNLVTFSPTHSHPKIPAIRPTLMAANATLSQMIDPDPGLYVCSTLSYPPIVTRGEMFEMSLTVSNVSTELTYQVMIELRRDVVQRLLAQSNVDPLRQGTAPTTRAVMAKSHADHNRLDSVRTNTSIDHSPRSNDFSDDDQSTNTYSTQEFAIISPVNAHKTLPPTFVDHRRVQSENDSYSHGHASNDIQSVSRSNISDHLNEGVVYMNDTSTSDPFENLSGGLSAPTPVKAVRRRLRPGDSLTVAIHLVGKLNGFASLPRMKVRRGIAMDKAKSLSSYPGRFHPELTLRNTSNIYKSDTGVIYVID